MIVNNFMRDLNTNLTKMDKLDGQLASGRKFAHISDDPTALIYGQAARNRIARLSHYQSSIGTAQDWIRQVEAGAMELQGRVTDIYEQIVNASTDVKGTTDKNNIAMMISQLRDHYVDTLNATFGDKYMYAGYNTPGDSDTGSITGPFTVDNKWNLYYNGQNLSDLLHISIAGTPVFPNETSGIFGGLKIDINNGADVTQSVPDTVSSINALTPQIDGLNTDIKNTSGDLSTITTDISTLTNEIAQLDKDMADIHDSTELQNSQQLRDQKAQLLAQRKLDEGATLDTLTSLQKDREEKLQELSKYINTDPPQYDAANRVTLTVGGVSLLRVDDPSGNVSQVDQPSAGDLASLKSTTDLISKLKSDVLTFDVGPSVEMPVTLNGIDLVLFQSSDGSTLNIFNVLHEAYNATSAGAPADQLGKFIKPLQDAQNHLLTKVAELGGRTRRLDLLSARYDQDAINYTQMQSDAEDADFSEVIMNQKMAESVYQAALSTGARIIQPTLMDFLR